MLWKISQRRSIDNGTDHLGRGGGANEGRTVVAKGNRSDLRIYIEEEISIEVGNVVALAEVVICQHVDAASVKDGVEVGSGLLALRTGESSLDVRFGRLVEEEGSLINASA